MVTHKHDGYTLTTVLKGLSVCNTHASLRLLKEKAPHISIKVRD